MTASASAASRRTSSAMGAMLASASAWFWMPAGPPVEVRQRNSSGRWRNGWTARPMASVTLSREFGFTRRMRALGTIE